MIAGSLLCVVLAADPEASPRAEGGVGVIATTVRVHLRASEDHEPDHLRALAKKNVTLWLSTRTNTLRASTLETITRFGDAWVLMRAPVREADAVQLEKIPHAGVWLDAKDLDGAQRLLGPRRLALELRGPLDAGLFDKLRKVRPFETLWHAPAEVDLLSWGLFRQLPGRKLLMRSPSELWPVQCPSQPAAAEPAIYAKIDPVLRTPGSAFPCGRAPRIAVPLDVDRAVLHALLVREPSAQLVIDIGDDSRAVSRARRLLEELGLK